MTIPIEHLESDLQSIQYHTIIDTVVKQVGPSNRRRDVSQINLPPLTGLSQNTLSVDFPSAIYRKLVS